MKKIYIIPETEVVEMTVRQHILQLSADIDGSFGDGDDFGTREFTFDTEDYDEEGDVQPFDW